MPHASLVRSQVSGLPATGYGLRIGTRTDPRCRPWTKVDAHAPSLAAPVDVGHAASSKLDAYGLGASVPGTRHPAPGSRFPVPDSRFPIPDSRSCIVCPMSDHLTRFREFRERMNSRIME